jgi:hypothetical protein
MLYNPAIMATKTAILILYYRIAAAHPFLRYASLFVMAVINIAGIVLTFIYIFQCRPVDAAFSVVDGTCIDIVALYLSSMPINVLTDLAILLLPLPILTSLRMELREKVILVATFIVGGFATVIDVVRIVYLQEALREELLVDPSATITATSRPPNFTYYASFSLMWSVVEVSVGIMCCCVLVLKPLVMRIIPDWFHKSSPQHAGWLLRPAVSPEGHSSDANQSDETPYLSPSPSYSTARQQETPQSTPTRESPRVERRPPPVTLLVVPEEEDSGPAMDFFEMLATEPPESYPDGRPRQHSVGRRSTISESRRNTIQAGDEQAPTQKILDFVNIQSKKPLTELSAREALWPVMFGGSKLDYVH